MSRSQINFFDIVSKSILRNEQKTIRFKKNVYRNVLSSLTETSSSDYKQEKEIVQFHDPFVFKDVSIITTLRCPEKVLDSLYSIYNKSHQKAKALDRLHHILNHEIDKECEEEEFKKFSEVARKNAQEVLDFIYNKFPQYEYDIYPTEDQEIAINCNPQKGKGVLVLCDSKGGLAFFATWDKENGMFRCSSMKDFLPYLHSAFERLVDPIAKKVIFSL